MVEFNSKEKEQLNFFLNVFSLAMFFSCLNGTLACIIAVKFFGIDWFLGLLALPIVIFSFFPLSLCFSWVAVSIYSIFQKLSK